MIAQQASYGCSWAYKAAPGEEEHLSLLEGGFCGTPTFASIRAHEGLLPFPRDDLESLGYMITYFFEGYLPWSGLDPRSPEEHDVIADAKRGLLRDQGVCLSMTTRGPSYDGYWDYAGTRPFPAYNPPAECLSYLRHCRRLRHGQRPDYDHLRCLFVELSISEGLDFSWEPNWANIDTDDIGDLPSQSFDEWSVFDSQVDVQTGVSSDRW